MLSTIKTISSDFNDLKQRIVKHLGLGKRDVRTSIQASPFGVDSNPVENMIAVYGTTNDRGETVIIGYLNIDQIAAVGEFRAYSTDEDGTLKISLWLKNNGTMELGGDADNLVRFKPTKDVVDEIQDDIKSLKDAFNTWVTVPNDGGAALKAAAATWAAQPLTKSIDDAKIEEIKSL